MPHPQRLPLQMSRHVTIRTLHLRLIGVSRIPHPPAKFKMALSPNDPNSFSRPEQCKVTNIELLLTVNFELQILSGLISLDVEKSSPDVSNLVRVSKLLVLSLSVYRALQTFHCQFLRSFGI